MKQIILVGVGAAATLALILPTILHKGEGILHLPDVLAETAPTMLFVGDIMLDRDVARHRRAAGAPALFGGVQDIFAKHDLIVGNLEGTITDNPSVSEVDNTILRFTFEPVVAQILRDAGISAVSLANNHALDFGEFGYDDTRYHLDQAGIASFGSPFNDTQLALQKSVHDKNFCFVGYHELFRKDPTKVIEKILEIEPTCDYTTLFAHWGVEYEHMPSASQQELARLFVDAGADVVIGAHPHVVQTLEVYNNVAIFYSLGNFVFDQGWKSDVKRGAMVSVEFADHETRFELIPVNTYLEATIANEEVSAAVLADLGIDSPTFVLKK